MEKALHWYQRAYGLRYAALRYFNAAGRRSRGRGRRGPRPGDAPHPAGDRGGPGGRELLEIFGTDYPTPDGTAIRDYIHVADLADAHLAALERLRAGSDSLAVNLGTGQGHSVRAVIAAVERATGRKVPVREVARRDGDPPALVADARLAAAVLGWTPKLPDLDTIVEHAFRWRTSRSAQGVSSSAALEVGAGG